MKSLLFTALLSFGAGHAGAFLSVWEMPYVNDHLTIQDVGRKLNKVFKWDEQANCLREAREEAREENYALLEINPERDAFERN